MMSGSKRSLFALVHALIVLKALGIVRAPINDVFVERSMVVGGSLSVLQTPLAELACNQCYVPDGQTQCVSMSNTSNSCVQCMVNSSSWHCPHDSCLGKACQTASSLLTQSLGYFNLSCPFEWTKYSCVHQGQVDRAAAARAYATSAWTTWAIPRRRVFVVGDSALRQQFISAGCNTLDAIGEYKIDWADSAKGWRWPCHGTINCIDEGEHSGFTVGSILWKNGGELHFIPHHGNPTFAQTEPNILQRWEHELTVTGKMTMGPNVELSKGPTTLQPNDVIVYQAGYHEDANKHREQVRSAASFGNRLANAGQRAPFFIFVTTPTQHFPGSNHGDFDATNSYDASSCVKHADDDRRMDTEYELLADFKNKTIKNRVLTLTDAHDLGDYHIDRTEDTLDCTHYCMPGVPDVVAKKLFDEIAHLEA